VVAPAPSYLGAPPLADNGSYPAVQHVKPHPEIRKIDGYPPVAHFLPRCAI